MAAFEYRFPELGEGLHEGEIVKWHIKAGDTVEEDQVIMEVQNDKAVVEVPSPVSGKVSEVKVGEGTVAHVGDVVAVFEVAGEVPAAPAHGGDSAAAAAPAPAAPAAAPIVNTPPTAGQIISGTEAPAAGQAPAAAGLTEKERREILATPGVRKHARDLGVDLRLVKGTGNNGRITREDVEGALNGVSAQAGEAVSAAQAESAAAPAAASSDAAKSAGAASAPYLEEERVPLKGVRKVIAQAMSKSVYTAPHVTLMDEVDVTALVAFRERVKPLAEKKGVKVTYLPFVVKAIVAALKQYPALNASIDDEKSEIIYKKYYNIGIATDTDNGLIVPVIQNADRKSILAIAGEIKDLAVRAREGKLAVHEMKGSSFSITNIGSAGGLFFTPVINWPEVAILGTGRITEKPVVRNGELAVGSVMALSLSFDHRLIDGATAQNALNYVKQLLADPELLVMEV